MKFFRGYRGGGFSASNLRLPTCFPLRPYKDKFIIKINSLSTLAEVGVKCERKATPTQYPIIVLYHLSIILSIAMFTSARYSYLALRLGLAAVFLWFGVDKMLHPNYWLNAWTPQVVQEIVAKLGLNGNQFIYVNGVFEILVGLSMLTGVFTRFFSMLASLFLISVLVFVGLSEVTVRDFAMLGGFIAVILWPNGRRF